ncbi:MAG: hypothetical protein AB8B86_10465 [Pseudomonadales bacterium]
MHQNRPLLRSPHSSSKNRGAVLIVVLVVMTALSLLAMSSMSDTNIQLAMVKNDQFYLNAHRVALSEINAQLDLINGNAPDDLDPTILALLEFDVDQPWELDTDELLGPHGGVGAFDQNISMAMACDPDDCLAPAGYSIDNQTRTLRVNLQSSASFGDTGARSDQIQGFWFLLPQGGGW